MGWPPLATGQEMNGYSVAENRRQFKVDDLTNGFRSESGSKGRLNAVEKRERKRAAVEAAESHRAAATRGEGHSPSREARRRQKRNQREQSEGNVHEGLSLIHI